MLSPARAWAGWMRLSASTHIAPLADADRHRLRQALVAVCQDQGIDAKTDPASQYRSLQQALASLSAWSQSDNAYALTWQCQCITICAAILAGEAPCPPPCKSNLP
jgi:hypothetical protein